MDEGGVRPAKSSKISSTFDNECEGECLQRAEKQIGLVVNESLLGAGCKVVVESLLFSGNKTPDESVLLPTFLRRLDCPLESFFFGGILVFLTRTNMERRFFIDALGCLLLLVGDCS